MTHAELPVRTRPLGVSPDTDILWPSGPLPGSVHDKKAEWVWAVPAELEAGPIVLADMGYQGAAHAKAPYRGKNKPESQNDANRVHAKLRSPGERANAQLKTWRILRKLRCCPWRAGQLAKAIRALQIRQANAGRRVGSWRGGIVRRQVPQPRLLAPVGALVRTLSPGAICGCSQDKHDSRHELVLGGAG